MHVGGVKENGSRTILTTCVCVWNEGVGLVLSRRRRRRRQSVIQLPVAITVLLLQQTKNFLLL